MNSKEAQYAAAYGAEVDKLSAASAEWLIKMRLAHWSDYGPAAIEAFQRRVDEEGCGAVMVSL
jgi:hypothetical protein